MSGVAVLIALLLDDGTVTAIAPPGNIIAGTLPQGQTLPALSIETISENGFEDLAPGAWIHVNERVQVTAYAADYVTAHNLLKAVKRACSNEFPEHAGLRDVAVLPIGGGPEGIHVASNSPSRSFDFRVSYEEPA